MPRAILFYKNLYTTKDVLDVTPPTSACSFENVGGLCNNVVSYA